MLISLKVNVKTAKQRLWEIIAHPENFPLFIPNIKDIRIVERDTKISLIRWKIEVDELEVGWIEQRHHFRDEGTISYRMIRGDFSAYAGSLSIQHAMNGVDLVWEIDIDWGLPSFSKVISVALEEKVRRSLRSMLLAIKRHAERARVDRLFAFVIHPLDLDLVSVAFKEPNIVNRRRDLLSKAFEWVQPFKCSDVVGLKSLDGSQADGALIYCPLLPEQMVSNNQQIALRRTIEAVKVAESLGVKIVGLGAYAAQIGKKGVLVSEAVQVPVTTGTSYTIATAIYSIELACKMVGADLHQMTVGIVGATGGVGAACAELLVDKVGGLIINARNETRLGELADRIHQRDPLLKVVEALQLDWVIANADVIITATSTPSALIDARSLRPGTIVCDVSRPRNVSAESVEEMHGSVLVFDGGVVRPPGDVDFDFYFGLPPGLAYACIAETMILALAHRYEGYSIGGNIGTSRVEEIARMGDAFGFQLAELRWCEREISQQTFDKVSNHLRKRMVRSWV